MLPSQLARFLRGGLASVISGSDARGRPVCGRCFGPQVDDGLQTLLVSVPAGTCDDLIHALRPGAMVALGFTRVSDFESYQVKGPVRAVRAASDADRTAVALHAAAFRAALEAVGYPLPDRLRTEGDVTIEVGVEAVYRQTPGPGAGMLWAGAEAGPG